METRPAPGPFPVTRVSVLARLRSDAPEERRVAFEAIVEAYWRPVYKYLRLKWRLPPEDAEDLTQGFFARALEKDVLARYEPERARFRTYLRLAVDGYAANEHKAGRRQKRGGGQPLLSLDFPTAEREVGALTPAVIDDHDAWFHQEWLRAILARAVNELRAATAASGRQVMFEVFARYDLADTEHRERPSYDDLAREFGLTPATVTNHLAAMRRDLRARVLDALRALTATDEEFEAEARRLFS